MMGQLEHHHMREKEACRSKLYHPAHDVLLRSRAVCIEQLDPATNTMFTSHSSYKRHRMEDGSTSGIVKTG